MIQNRLVDLIGHAQVARIGQLRRRELLAQDVHEVFVAGFELFELLNRLFREFVRARRILRLEEALFERLGSASIRIPCIKRLPFNTGNQLEHEPGPEPAQHCEQRQQAPTMDEEYGKPREAHDKRKRNLQGTCWTARRETTRARRRGSRSCGGRWKWEVRHGTNLS
jgi:hypothetical protein